MAAVDNYDFWANRLDWNPGEFVRWIVIVQRDKDQELRTETEYWEAKEYQKTHPHRNWVKRICTIPLVTSHDFESSQKTVTTLCKALGARAYLFPNKTYARESAEHCLISGIGPDHLIVSTINHFGELYTIHDKPYLVGGGGYRWPREKSWWYELDCDTNETGGHVEDWKAEKDKAIETVRNLTTVTCLHEVPSKTGIHVYFRIEEPEFPEEKYKEVMGDECTFHENPVANLYIPDRRYSLTPKQRIA